MRHFVCASLLLLMAGCDRSDVGRPSGVGQPSPAEIEEYLAKTEAYNREMDRQLKVAAEQLDVVEQQGKRYDALLDKWEEQARRFDAILDRWEKVLPRAQEDGAN